MNHINWGIYKYSNYYIIKQQFPQEYCKNTKMVGMTTKFVSVFISIRFTTSIFIFVGYYFWHASAVRNRKRTLAGQKFS